MTERFHQFRARLEDRLKVFCLQFQKDPNGQGRERFVCGHSSQKRNLTKGVAGSNPAHIQHSPILHPSCCLKHTRKNEVDRLRCFSLREKFFPDLKVPSSDFSTQISFLCVAQGMQQREMIEQLSFLEEEKRS